MVTPDSPMPAERAMVDSLLRDYHDARRREDQWRIPQILLALITPIFALATVLFAMAERSDLGMPIGALTVITGVGAALLAVEVWRWHRTAIGIANRVRTDYPSDTGLLMRDPL